MKVEDFKVGQRVKCILMKGEPWNLLNKTGTVVSVDRNYGTVTVQYDKRIIRANNLPWEMESYQLKEVA